MESKHIIFGRLVVAPEIKYSKTGKPYSSLLIEEAAAGKHAQAVLRVIVFDDLAAHIERAYRQRDDICLICVATANKRKCSCGKEIKYDATYYAREIDESWRDEQYVAPEAGGDDDGDPPY